MYAVLYIKARTLRDVSYVCVRILHYVYAWFLCTLYTVVSLL